MAIFTGHSHSNKFYWLSFYTTFIKPEADIENDNPGTRFFTVAKHICDKYGLKFAEKDDKVFKVIK